MKVYTASEARIQLFNLIDTIADSREPVIIKGRRNESVLINSEDFRSIQETLYLMSIPNMVSSIYKGKEEPLDNCSKTLEW